MYKRIIAAVVLLIAAGFVLTGCQTTKRHLKELKDTTSTMFFDADEFDKEVR